MRTTLDRISHRNRRFVVATALSLVLPSLLGVLYQCTVTGAVLAEPCAQDEQLLTRSEDRCCAESEPPDGPAVDCCEWIDTEPSILSPVVVVDEDAAASVILSSSARRAELQSRPAPPVSRRGPGPGANDSPTFLLNCQFLC